MESTLIMDDYYMTCNPPLLPSGVAHVINSFNSHQFGDDGDEEACMEITYDPEMGWFRYMCFVSKEPIVTKVLESILEEIVEQETDLIDVDEATDTNSKPVDVTIVAEEPRVIPWSLWVDGQEDQSTAAEQSALRQYLAPVDFEPDTEFKAIWRSLEPHDGLTFTHLFEICRQIFKSSGFPETKSEFALNHNFSFAEYSRDTTLFLSSQDETSLNKAIEILDSLVAIQLLWPAANEHFIFCDDASSLKYNFQWMTHLKLYSKTLCCPSIEDPADPGYESTAKAVVLRTLRREGDVWVVNRNKYEQGDVTAPKKGAPMVLTVFHPFELKSKPRGVGRCTLRDAFESSPTSLVEATSLLDGLDLSCHSLPALQPTSATVTQPVGRLVEQELDIRDSMSKETDLIDFDETDETSADQANDQREEQKKLLEIPRKKKNKRKKTKSPHIGISTPIITPQRPSYSSQRLVHKTGHLENLLEKSMRNQIEFLRRTPGLVELKLEFGRIYLRNISGSMIADGTAELSWDLPEIVEFLRTRVPREGTCFSSILSTREADAGELIKTAPADKGSPWKRTKTSVFYDVQCRLPGESQNAQTDFMVEVSASDFSYAVRGKVDEISAVYVHCPKQAWDIKISAQKFGTNDSNRLETVSALMNNMAINVKSNRTIEFQFHQNAEMVQAVYIRRISTFESNGYDGSLLDLALISAIERSEGQRNRFRGNADAQFGPMTTFKGNPAQWLQASLSSRRGRELLSENMRMGYGDQASYDVEQFERERISREIYSPALVMASRMDRIGATNNHDVSLINQDPISEEYFTSQGKKPEVPGEFW